MQTPVCKHPLLPTMGRSRHPSSSGATPDTEAYTCAAYGEIVFGYFSAFLAASSKTSSSKRSSFKPGASKLQNTHRMECYRIECYDDLVTTRHAAARLACAPNLEEEWRATQFWKSTTRTSIRRYSRVS